MRIILDLDDVLCDFRSGACRVHGKTVEELTQQFGTWWHGPEFWLPIMEEGPAFWSGLGRFPWFQQLVNIVDSVSQGAWLIATALPDDGHCLPGLNATCAAGKVEWISRQFGSKFSRFHIGSVKHYYAKEKTLLIDDRELNCERFKEHGGQAIIFPSHGNKFHQFKDDPIVAVKHEFRRLNLL